VGFRAAQFTAADAVETGTMTATAWAIPAVTTVASLVTATMEHDSAMGGDDGCGDRRW
jgi:hypothetical protein